jgi:hypothetical protein
MKEMRFYTLVFLFVFWGGLLTGITAQATDRVPARCALPHS